MCYEYVQVFNNYLNFAGDTYDNIYDQQLSDDLIDKIFDYIYRYI